MLDGFARHGLFDLELFDVSGDLDVDCHHTIEDAGIVLGGAIRRGHWEIRLASSDMGVCCFRWMRRSPLCAIDLSGQTIPEL